MSRPQLLSAGVRRSAIQRARGGDRLFDVHPGFGVYSLVPPELLSADGRLHAALLAVGGRGVLGGGTAAYRWGLTPAPPMTVELLVPFPRSAPGGVTLHHSPRLRPEDVTHDGTFPITTVARTLLDLAVHYERDPLLAAIAEAEFHHRITPEVVLQVLRRGHAGSARLRAALARHVPGLGPVRSRLERRFRALLVEHGIALPERNRRVGPFVVDCLWREARLVVEVDGAQHQRPRQSAVDAERDLWLRRNGYEVRRYSSAQILERPGLVAADVATALGAGLDAN